MGKLKKALRHADGACVRVWTAAKSRLALRTRRRMDPATETDAGQGTTEYAILVGVLVVIAILAIMVFRPRLQELWNAIAEGISGL